MTEPNKSNIFLPSKNSNNSYNSSNQRNNISGLLKKWKSSRPNIADPIWIWDEIIIGRKVSLENEDGNYNNDILNHFSFLHVSTASAGMHQNNLQIVHGQLTKSNSSKQLLKIKKNNLSLDEIKIVCNWNDKTIKNKSYDEADATFETTLNLLAKTTDNGFNDIIPLLLMKGDWLSKWSKFEKYNYYNHNSDVNNNNNNNNRIRDKPQWIIKNSQALESFTTATNMCEDRNVSTALRTEAYGKLAKYCNGQLREMETEYEENLNNLIQIESRMVMATGREREREIDKAMKKKDYDYKIIQNLSVRTVQAFVNGLLLENSYCQDQLLRLTELIGKYPHTESLLTTSLSKIPTWIFLKFSPQLIGILDQPEGKIATRILYKIAKIYPRALFYSYHITKEFLGLKGTELCNQSVDYGSNLELEKKSNNSSTQESESSFSSSSSSSTVRSLKSKLNQKNQKLVTEVASSNSSRSSSSLSELLKDEALESFVQALNGLTHPELRWNDGLRAIVKICNFDLSKALLIYEDMYDNVLSLKWSKVRTFYVAT